MNQLFVSSFCQQYWLEYTNVVCVSLPNRTFLYSRLENISSCEPLVMNFELVVFLFFLL